MNMVIVYIYVSKVPHAALSYHVSCVAIRNPRHLR